MCGIFCVLNQSGELIDIENVKNEFDKIKNRGPDASIFKEIDEKVLFGFHRLRINGVNSNSDQPLIDDNVYLICNGEIFNTHKLREKYNLIYSTNSDCEVILKLYNKFGIYRTVQELDGEFAFILYNKNEGLLYICRDHIGIRPLFIGTSESDYLFGFASEAKALSIFDNVMQYAPAQITEYNLNNKTSNTSKWYNFNTMSNMGDLDAIKYDNREDILKDIKSLLIQSIEDRINLSDRPCGVFLSGGLDSSLVTSISSRKDKNIPSFSIGLEGSLDLLAARKVVEFLGLKNHHEVTFTVDEAISAIPRVIKAIESYDITTVRASLPHFLLTEYISNNTDVKVLLSGEVPDESIPGYFAFAFCESDKAFCELSKNMIENLHLYDLLRTDRVTATFGLEVRVPFAKKELLKLFHNIDVTYRRFDKNTIEKSLLRDAFRSDGSSDSINYLPHSILNRKKHAFSDAIDNDTICLHEEIEKYADSVIDKIEWDDRGELYPINTPVSKESFYYRKLFSTIYPNRDNLIPRFWLPKIKDENGDYILNPSATALPDHKIDTEF